MPKLLKFLLLGVCCLWISSEANAETLISTNSAWKHFKGLSEPTPADKAAWRKPGFDDSTWALAAAPFYFDKGNSGVPYSGNTPLPDMQGNYNTLFLRTVFSITNTLEIASLKLSFWADDGFVVWINGVELTRQNVSASNPLTFNSSTTVATEPIPLKTLDLASPRPATYLVEGENVIAIQAFNATKTDDDFFFALGVSSVTQELTRPRITTISPPPGSVTSLSSLTVTFSEPVTGVDANDLLINGAPAETVEQNGNSFLFRFVQPLYGSVAVDWDAASRIIDLNPIPNGFDTTAPENHWNYTLLDVVPPSVAALFPASDRTLRSLTQVEVTFSEGVNGVDASDLQINGIPATSVRELPGSIFQFEFPQPAAGAVTISWAPSHGITDLATPPLPFGGGHWNYTLDPSTTPGDLVITEILALNQSGLLDEDGEPSGWIELWNRGSTPVALADWSLSDDPKQPGQWIFPERILPPGQYLVVFTSGKDRRSSNPPEPLHTNFKLAAGGEFLGLYTPESPRQAQSSMSPRFPEQRLDISYGLTSDGEFRYFTVPTPGSANSQSILSGVTAAVDFNVGRGVFKNPFSLSLSCPTPGAVIRYTLDGTDPTDTHGRIFYQTLRITNTTLLRAAAFRSGLLPSHIQTQSYLFGLSSAQRSLPVISLVTAGNNLTGPTGIVGMSGGSRASDGLWTASGPNDYHNPSKHGIAWERPTSMELIRPGDNSGFQIDCGIRVQGSDYQRPRTTEGSKFSYRLYFRGDYGAGKLRYPLMRDSSVEVFDQIVLRAGFNDPDNPFLRDELTRQLSADMGLVSSHGLFANLFINGQYRGYYNPAERVEETTLQGYHGGGPDWDVIGQFGQVVDGDRTDLQKLLDFMNASNLTQAKVYQSAGEKLDLENFVDYLLLNIYGAMGDWPNNNWRAAKDRSPGGIWRFYVWDAEWAMGIYGRSPSIDTFSQGGGGPDDSGLSSGGEIATLYQRLRVSPEFRLLFADRIQKHFFNGGALTDTNILKRFNEMKTELNLAIPGIDPSIQTTWIPQRRPVLMGLFNKYGLIASSNAPAFSQFGGRVPRGYPLIMTNLEGAIYYTLDGTDPREAFSGSISSNAVIYTSPIALNAAHRVKARSFKNLTWSALTSADFKVETVGSPLRIAEIMYNPTGGNAYEFVELHNSGTAPLDLSGMSFDGITYVLPDNSTLAPDARLVIASGAAPLDFAARYPGISVFGNFAGNLSNNGERLAIKDLFGNPIHTVDYSDGNGWPESADGGGYSVELTDPEGDPSSPANWHASEALGGSPGRASNSPTPSALRLSEIMASNISSVTNGGTNPDWIELRNNGTTTLPLDGFSLSNNGDPRRYVFPSGLNLTAGGHLVVWCDANLQAPGLHSGFTLNTEGDQLFLYDAKTNRIDAVSFGLQIPDLSIAKIDGAWTLAIPTPAALNRPQPVGSVASLSVNEWLANAAAGQPDWVELYNRDTNAPIALGGVWVATTNALSRIPPLSYIAPGGYAQLFADDGTGPTHLLFKLNALGGFIALIDPLGTELQRINYPKQTEGVTQGRLPDGAPTLSFFPGTSSPLASNFALATSGPVLNEVLAKGVAGESDWFELYNPGTAALNLGGYLVRIDDREGRPWVFPAGTILPPNGYLSVACNPFAPASIRVSSDLNTGQAISATSGAVYLFNPAGQLLTLVELGVQIAGKSVGLSGNQWTLLGSPTRGASNATPSVLGNLAAVRFNEWMANPLHGNDWIELFNTTNVPVALAGGFLSDDPSLSGTNLFQIPPLSFIAPNSWVTFVADSDPSSGRDHLSFSLDPKGESLRLFNPSGVLMDSVDFGSQRAGVAEGLLPDGSNRTTPFPQGGTPGSLNFVPLDGLVLSEIVVDRTNPTQRGIELKSTSPIAKELGGFFLTDDPSLPRKIALPANTRIEAGGFLFLPESTLRPLSLSGFQLTPDFGGELWILEADASGKATGRAVHASYPISTAAPSYVRTETSDGVLYLPSLAATPGSPNALPKFGPVILSELMIQPSTELDSGGRDEFVELSNLSGDRALLYDTLHPDKTWKLSGGIDFLFPAQVDIAPNGRIVVVSFDPQTDATSAGQFRARYQIGASVKLFGPYQGRLANSGETVRLEAPLPPEGTSVRYQTVEEVHYDSSPPWPPFTPLEASRSLHRRTTPQLGVSTDPNSWAVAAPTPGTAAPSALPTGPIILASPASLTATAGAQIQLTVQATGTGTLRYEWRRDGNPIAKSSAPTLTFDWVETDDEATYDVRVTDDLGSSLSQPARLSVVSAPFLVLYPENLTLKRGATLTLQAFALGNGPIEYRWFYNGVPWPGGNGPSLVVSNLQLLHEGLYSVTAENTFGSTSATGRVSVLAAPLVTTPLQPLIALEGQTVTFSVGIEGTRPLSYRWSRNSANLLNQTNATLTLTNLTLAQAGNYGLAVSNLAGKVTVPAVALSVLADGDRDGLPDSWELQFGLNPAVSSDGTLDSDGDGLSNRQEYLAGTDPRSSLSLPRLTLLSETESSVTLQFFAPSNRLVSLDSRNEVNSGDWKAVQAFPLRATNRVEVFTTPLSAEPSHQYFRLSISGAQ